MDLKREGDETDPAENETQNEKVLTVEFINQTKRDQRAYNSSKKNQRAKKAQLFVVNAKCFFYFLSRCWNCTVIDVDYYVKQDEYCEDHPTSLTGKSFCEALK